MLKLNVRNRIGKACTEEEKQRMLGKAAKARSPHIYLALTLALNAGMRDAEIKSLSWTQIDFAKKFLAVGRSKTEGGEGRTIPLNSDLFAVLTDYVEWYKLKFGATRPEWYVFPFGSPQPTDPTRHVTTLKTVWNNIREKAGVKGRWHDNRHTLVTGLAESGAGDQTIMDIAGHVSKQMLKHYSHIRMEAKRKALESVVTRRTESGTEETESGTEEIAAEDRSGSTVIAQDFEAGYPQKPSQSGISEGHRGVYRKRKSKNLIGSSGRTRTYNPSVNSRVVKHGVSM